MPNLTTLELRQNLVEVVTSFTTLGTVLNSVPTIYYHQPDAIAFDTTPAIVVSAPKEVESVMTLGGPARTWSDVMFEIEYFDAPISGDDQQTGMDTAEAWIEKARTNLRHNTTGDVGPGPSWLQLLRIDTRIDKPLTDKGRIFYHACMYVYVRSNPIQVV